MNRSGPDTLGLWEATAAQPERTSEAFDAASEALAGVHVTGGVRTVVVVGVGAGGIAAAAATALTDPHSPVPIGLVAGPSLPAFVDAHTLVLAVSCSGATTSTVEAAESALTKGASVIVVAPDGSFDALDDRALARCPIGPSGAAGRSAVGPATVSVLAALSRAGVAPDPGSSVKAAVAALTRRRDRLFEPGGPAEHAARLIGSTFPLVYGSAGVTAVAARRWKSQVNLNAKAPAFCGSLPELAHNELAGWGHSGDVTRQVVSLVLLRHDGEDGETARLFDVVTQTTDEVMAGIIEVTAEGDDDLTRFLDLSLFGDVVSLHLAEREGVDPGPVPTVDAAIGGAGAS